MTLPASLTPAARLGSLALLLLAAPLASAQWSEDPTVNLPVADAAGEQVQPKLAPTPDGGVWIAWYDGASGYDVRVQKLDVGGNAVFAPAGLLVADRSFSSTQDYGLDVDASGNALLTFRDDRGTGTQITAALVTTAGTQPWGPTGVQLTNTTAFVSAPKITGASDGSAFVAWGQDATTRLQKLDAAGVPQWASDVVLTPPAGLYFLCDLRATGTDAILSIHHQTGSFGSPRHLLAQKFDATGASLWGATPLAVFDGGSLQVAYFPAFVLDGAGGAVFTWYDVAGSLQSYVQRVLSNGTEAFAHNGLAVSTNAGQLRVSPDAAFDAATQDLYVFWTELSLNQGQRGVYGQKVDAAGNRQWTDTGLVVEPVGNDDVSNVQTVVNGPGAFVFWAQAPGFGQDQLLGAAASGDAGGTVDFTVDVSTTPSGKSRLQAVNSTAGFAVLAWQDARDDGGDIYAQNVNPDGTLGGGGCLQDLAATLDNPSPAPGDVITFAVTVTNNDAAPAPLDLWVDATGPVNRRVRLASGTLPAGVTVMRNVRLRVPSNAPSGAYSVDLNIGDFGTDAVCDAVPFTITVTASVASRPVSASAMWDVIEGSDFFSARASTGGETTVAPNPFAGRTQIRYAVEAAADVRLAIYDVLGREVAVLVDGRVEAGAHTAPFDARRLAAGTYVYRLTTGAEVQTGRLTLMR